ncbi:TetR/AcrR family transcriptional regulator [Amycolatopsis sp.]|uniref:TetR/AcrR family transcriptional regulator n=1 Tax=Amycolatopsis sp. TaxID=37632 RepID=UPI0039C889DF
MTTAKTRGRGLPDRAARDDDPGGFRRRLLDALAECIAEDGYRRTTVADVVRRARTSRRTFYQYFSDKEACFVALLTDTNQEVIRHISAAVDPKAPWGTQIRQAVEAWISAAKSAPALTVSWIRDVPALGEAARGLQRTVMDEFVTMIQTLSDTGELRAAGIHSPSRCLVIILLGGLRELMATTVEDGGNIGDVTDLAVQASIALLAPDPGQGRAFA